MKNEMIELTKTEPNCAIKFGEIDNTDIANKIIEKIKEKLGIEIMLFYSVGDNLECHLRNPNRCDIESPIIDKNEFFGIVNEVLVENNLGTIEFKSIRFVDFDIEVVSLLLINSVPAIKKLINKRFCTEVKMFYPMVESNTNVLNHHIVIYSKKDLDNIAANGGIKQIKDCFEDYISQKDKWNVFNNFEYSPILLLSSDLNKDQQFSLDFYGL